MHAGQTPSQKNQAAWVLAAAIGMILGLPTACENPDNPLMPWEDEAEAPIQMDAETFELEVERELVEGSIGYEFTNVTDSTVFIQNCNGHFEQHVERWNGDEWVLAWGPDVEDCLSEPIWLAPGESIEYNTRIAEQAEPPDRWTLSGEPIEGTYRLVITSVYDEDEIDTRIVNRQPPPLEHRLSGKFEIRVDG